MVISVFDLFKVGIGPSSSHTVGPMWAANRFLLALDARRLIERVERVEVQLYGSLALTGKGHATDRAILLGLAGEVPDEVDPDAAGELVRAIRETGALRLMGRREIAFSETLDLQFRQLETMTKHPNGMRFLAHDGDGAVLLEEVYFSVGGGFVLSDAETERPRGEGRNATPPYPFATAEELLALGERHKMTIAEIVLANERAWREPAEIRAGLDALWQAMEASIERGCRQGGELPGGLRVRRRAARLFQELCERPEAGLRDQLTVLDWVNLYALAVNEENAAGGRVVTAPT
ncbi:MAG: L-serine ammonia-lyase, partial [Geminicoccaceae bacterium]|nr:L-serine ammonia-lyase [Geminicoccaceae bacterium]